MSPVLCNDYVPAAGTLRMQTCSHVRYRCCRCEASSQSTQHAAQQLGHKSHTRRQRFRELNLARGNMSEPSPGPRMFPVPVGVENEHQRTIEGQSPIGPCWGFTDGNYLANTTRTNQGDVLLFVRARSKTAAASIYRLAVVEHLFRNPQLAGQLYKTQHNYSMGVW